MHIYTPVFICIYKTPFVRKGMCEEEEKEREGERYRDIERSREREGERQKTRQLERDEPRKRKGGHISSTEENGFFTYCKDDSDGIRTPAGRAQWIASPSP